MPDAIFDNIASVYDLTRTLPPEIMERSLGALVDILGEDSTLLDVGIGTGRFAVPLSARGVDVTGIDISCAMMDKCREKGFSQMMQASAFNLPFRDKSFDNAIMVHVLHLMEDWKAALTEVCRVTSSSLVSVVSVWPPNDVWAGNFYGRRVDELGYRAQAGIFERELADLIPPGQTIPIGKFTKRQDNDQYIQMLEDRQVSSANKLPDDLHIQVIRETRENCGGIVQDVEGEVSVCVWNIEELSKSLLNIGQ